MSEFKSFIDVLEVALRIERKGVELYKALCASVTVPAAHDMLNYLAAQQEKHIGFFRAVLDDKAEYLPRYDYPGEYGHFIEEVSGRLMDHIQEMVETLTPHNVPEAIEVGLYLENESIRFYQELLKEDIFVDDEKEILQKIIKEEEGHLANLQQMKREYFSV